MLANKIIYVDYTSNKIQIHTKQMGVRAWRQRRKRREERRVQTWQLCKLMKRQWRAMTKNARDRLFAVAALRTTRTLSFFWGGTWSRGSRGS